MGPGARRAPPPAHLALTKTSGAPVSASPNNTSNGEHCASNKKKASQSSLRCPALTKTSDASVPARQKVSTPRKVPFNARRSPRRLVPPFQRRPTILPMANIRWCSSAVIKPWARAWHVIMPRVAVSSRFPTLSTPCTTCNEAYQQVAEKTPEVL